MARVRHEFISLPEIADELALLPLDEPFAPFTLPRMAKPHVSIVIPVHGKLPYTLACLRSLARHGAQVGFEVIVVDDASPDESAIMLAQIEGLRLLSNERNLGFVDSCNEGAAAAKGQFLLFLNNDTQVTPGWLDALLACFAERPDCGIAGPRLVYPDGRLQEAGGLVFADGSCWNTGRFEARNTPAYQYRRRTDYVTGAAMLLRREVFDRVGGFDTRYRPAYYEDTDLAFAVRQLGLSVYYEPASTVIHFEGITSGTDLANGTKRHQVTNQATFAAKWRTQLAAQPPPGTPLQRAVHWHARGRVLVVDGTMPDPARDSGSLRLCNVLRLLDAHRWSTCFFPDDRRAGSTDTLALGRLGCEVLAAPDAGELPQWLAQHGRELHAVMLCRHTVAGQYAGLIRRHAPQARLIFDTVDLHFIRERRAAELAGNPALLRQAEASQRSELALIEQSDVTVVVSALEQALLARMLPDARVELLSNIHEVHGSTRPHAERKDLVFIGGWHHPPNADAIRWIAGAILPRLREALPQIRIHILGDMPEDARTALTQPGMEIHGRVAQLEPWLDGCLASLAPLRFGAGVKGKINMAMSHGLPVIATTIAVEGMQLTDGSDVLVADDPHAYAEAVMRLVRDASLWQRLSEQGMENVSRHFSAGAAAATLERMLG